MQGAKPDAPERGTCCADGEYALDIAAVVWRMIKVLARELSGGFVSLLYPRRCVACGCPADEEGGSDFCSLCEASLLRLRPPYCEVCALPVDGDVPATFSCANCGNRRFAFDFAYAPFRGRGVVRELLHRFKYRKQASLAGALGRLLRFAGEEPRIEAVLSEAIITAVPLHPRRLRERGFNQAELLGRVFAAEMGRPFLKTLRRVRYTTTQTALDRDERMRNLRDAFSLGQPPARLKGATLIIVDDVLTTCSTAHECARILKKAGVRRAIALGVARA